jgi:uncharacterized protein
MLQTPAYFYLHGFASSPRSAKCRDLVDRFADLNLTLHAPDLNLGGFSQLTLTRQLRQVEAAFPPDRPIVLIGSSFGGLTAAWLGQRVQRVERLVLLAPAFDFLTHWQAQLGPMQLQQWQQGQPLLIHHYGEQRPLPLEYQFVTDLANYQEDCLDRPIPTLILHGIQDAVIPLAASCNYANGRPWVELIQLNSDHGLLDMSGPIWLAIQHFCQLALH